MECIRAEVRHQINYTLDKKNYKPKVASVKKLKVFLTGYKKAPDFKSLPDHLKKLI